MCYSIIYADFIALHIDLLYNRVHRTQAVSKKPTTITITARKDDEGGQSREEMMKRGEKGNNAKEK